LSISLKFNLFLWENINDYINILNEIENENETGNRYSFNNVKETLSYPSFDEKKNLFIISDNYLKKIGILSISEEKQIGRAIADIKILKQYKNQVIQSKIIMKALELVRNLPIKVLHIAVNQNDKLIQFSLKETAFTKIKTYLNMELNKLFDNNAKLPEGFHFSEFILNSNEKHLTLLQNKIFKNSWGFCPNTIEEVSYKINMHNTNPKGIIIITNNYEYVGYNWTTLENNFGKISMTGVHPEFRSIGLGKMLVIQGVLYLLNKKYNTVKLEVDSLNSKAIQLYNKIGFEKKSEIWWYENRLGN